MRRAVALLILSCLAGCGDDLVAPVTLTAGALRVRVSAQPARIEVLAGDAVVWQTLAGGAVAAGAPPHVMSGFRTADASVQMLLGSFKIEEPTPAAAPWTGVDQLADLAASDAGDAVTFTLRAGGADVGTGVVRIADAAAGHVEVRLRFADGDRASLATPCGADEHFLGLGGQSWDVDHRGQTVPLWVQEDGIGKSDGPDDRYDGVWFLTGRRHSTHSPMPMMVSSAGYGLAVATDARATFALCSEDARVARFETWSPELDLHLFVGHAFETLDAMTAWVGRPDVPPPVVFAPWLDALYGSANVRRVAAKARAEGVAVSAIWTEDWRGGADGGTGYTLEEDWHADPALYPDFAALAADLHDDGYLFLTYNNTFTDSKADIYDEAIAGGYTIHDTAGDPYLFMGVKFEMTSMLDLANPDAIAWAKGVYRAGLALGADGWMADYGEWLPTDAALHGGADALVAHNPYAREWARLNHDLARERAAAGQPFVYFMRSAWLGSQPLVQVLWPGDQQTDFSPGDGFPSVIPMAIGLGMTGFPYFGSDIGGYMSQTTVPTTRELWWRWVALGALSPVMRTHHGRSAKQNWNWEQDAETTALFRRWTRFHMQLVPYLASLADDAHARGLPLIRPIALTYPDTGAWAWTTTDEYLLGDIVVAPVVTEGATSRAVMLPQGRFYPLFGGDPVVGGDAAIEVAAPLGEIPAFVPEGTIIPAWPDGVDTVLAAPADPQLTTAAKIGGDRELWLWPAESGGGVRCERGGVPCYSWSARHGAAGPATTATWNGAPVEVSHDTGAATAGVNVTGNGVLEFAGGGRLIVDGAGDAARFHVVLRNQ